VRRLIVGFLAALGLCAGLAAWWLNRPLSLKTEPVELAISAGMSGRSVAKAVADAGVQIQPALLYWWFRLSGDARDIKAGSYEIGRGTTPRSLLRKLVQGEEIMRAVTLVEGWNFRQVREALLKADMLRPDSQELDDIALMERLGRPGQHPEGRFFPDTYIYAKGSSDLAVLRRAMRVMDQQLEAAWSQRAPGVAIKTPEQALILASIVEKETGRSSDRSTISAVFNNRLRIGMLLQTDPTVIYGLGDKFDGNLRKRDLLKDTPWNTYTRAGLPPTPIAMPGKAALLAAVQPAPSNALYFVARGDGTSQFSATLSEHNRAVNKYQLGR
jgi:UPF0755 protein